MPNSRLVSSLYPPAYFRFSELNQYGLPRAVDEVELNLGTLKLHAFPHQVSGFRVWSMEAVSRCPKGVKFVSFQTKGDIFSLKFYP